MFSQIRKYYQNIIPNLTQEKWHILENYFSLKYYKKGDLIIKAGQVCNEVWYINKGFVRVFIIKDDKDISTGFFIKDQYISAYESFLTQKPSTDNIQAMEDCELIALNYNQIQELYKTEPIFEKFGRIIAENLFISISQRTNYFQVLTPEQRYEYLLDKNSQLIQLIPQYMLASYLGITAEHLSRIRKKISKKLININK